MSRPGPLLFQRLQCAKQGMDFFNRQHVDYIMQFRPFWLCDRSRDGFGLEERQPFHPATFILNGGVCGIVFRHLRAHVADDGLDDR